MWRIRKPTCPNRHRSSSVWRRPLSRRAAFICVGGHICHDRLETSRIIDGPAYFDLFHISTVRVTGWDPGGGPMCELRLNLPRGPVDAVAAESDVARRETQVVVIARMESSPILRMSPRLLGPNRHRLRPAGGELPTGGRAAKQNASRGNGGGLGGNQVGRRRGGNRSGQRRRRDEGSSGRIQGRRRGANDALLARGRGSTPCHEQHTHRPNSAHSCFLIEIPRCRRVRPVPWVSKSALAPLQLPPARLGNAPTPQNRHNRPPMAQSPSSHPVYGARARTVLNRAPLILSYQKAPAKSPGESVCAKTASVSPFRDIP